MIVDAPGGGKGGKKPPRKTGKEDAEASGSESESDSEKKIFDPETGTLGRAYKSFRPNTNPRGFGRTRALDKHPFLSPQIMLLVGGTGSGKTTLALNILEEIMENVNESKLGQVMFYSGSPGDTLLHTLDPDTVDLYAPAQTQALLTDLRALQVGGMGVPEPAKKLNVLVLDDCATNKDLTPSNAKGTDIGDVIVGHRHIPLILIMMVQKWNMAPTVVRANMSHAFIFPGKSTKELSEMYNALPLPSAQLEKAMKLVGTDPHSFLWVDLVRKTAKRNFDQTLLE